MSMFRISQGGHQEEYAAIKKFRIITREDWNFHVTWKLTMLHMDHFNNHYKVEEYLLLNRLHMLVVCHNL